MDWYLKDVTAPAEAGLHASWPEAKDTGDMPHGVENGGATLEETIAFLLFKQAARQALTRGRQALGDHCTLREGMDSQHHTLSFLDGAYRLDHSAATTTSASSHTDAVRAIVFVQYHLLLSAETLKAPAPKHSHILNKMNKRDTPHSLQRVWNSSVPCVVGSRFVDGGRAKCGRAMCNKEAITGVRSYPYEKKT